MELLDLGVVREALQVGGGLDVLGDLAAGQRRGSVRFGSPAGVFTRVELVMHLLVCLRHFSVTVIIR